MDPKPLVSVILPVFNGEEFVGCALESALSQTWQNIEVLAIDDGSTDGTPGVLESSAARDNRFRVFGLPEVLYQWSC
jgi:glycosyltransferase involved in cell wall biosynthesis